MDEIDIIENPSEHYRCEKCDKKHSCEKCMKNIHICRNCGKIMHECSICGVFMNTLKEIRNHQKSDRICIKSRYLTAKSIKDIAVPIVETCRKKGHIRHTRTSSCPDIITLIKT